MKLRNHSFNSVDARIAVGAEKINVLETLLKEKGFVLDKANKIMFPILAMKLVIEEMVKIDYGFKIQIPFLGLLVNIETGSFSSLR